MFLSAQALAIEYGIDDRIAKFYVDREPPPDNLYWKDKLLYLRPQPGYLFIPLIADLFYRSGIAIEILLSEEYIGTMEQVLHLAAEQEYDVISHEMLNEACSAIAGVASRNKETFDLVTGYFAGEKNDIYELAVPFKALHRGDVFLYSMCVLDIDQAKFLSLVKTWFALISTLLLMDDSEDYINDLASGDENVFIESGSSREGFDRIKNMLSVNLDHIQSINYSMAHALHKKVVNIPGKPGIKEYLNA
jgi:hypothetical protein